MSKKKQEAPQMQSADDKILLMEAEKLGKDKPDIKLEDKKIEPEESPKEVEESKNPNEQDQMDSDDVDDKEPKEEQSKSESEPEEKYNASDTPSDEVDEYGTKVGKPKTYTEEEVQNMIRDRLKRGRHSENQEGQQERQEAAKDFTPDQESGESWEEQLDRHIDKHLDKKSREAKEREWKAEEQQKQDEFEVKFSQGMAKYKDFGDVVGSKPVTGAMMLAARTMENPAAFLYAACKQQPKEIERIASIKDPVTQATEIGRLEERMKKARTITSSPKPPAKIKGDASSDMPRIDIDSRIAAHAKSKIMR